MATVRELAKLIDHSLLHPTMTDRDIRDGCELAAGFETATVCVKPYSIPLAAEVLRGSSAGICAVAAFPHGNSTTACKVHESVEAVRAGATEIDTVVNVGKVLGGDWAYVEAEVRAINAAVISEGAILKLIFENDFLQDEHIVRLCRICNDARVAFAKTSTGYGFVKRGDGSYGYAGATEHHVALMRRTCSPEVQIKAAGGIRTLDAFLRARELGAARIGVSATKAILEEAAAKGE